MTFDGFNKLYEKNVKKCKSYKEAYELTEEIHENVFGCRCYNDHDVFKQARYRFIKKEQM